MDNAQSMNTIETLSKTTHVWHMYEILFSGSTDNLAQMEQKVSHYTFKLS